MAKDPLKHLGAVSVLDNVVGISVAVDIVIISLAVERGTTINNLGRLVVGTASLKVAIGVSKMFLYYNKLQHKVF